MASINEELTSVNQQLESKVTELEAVTNDLQNLLRSTEIATLFLDRKLCIRRFTPAVRKLLNLIPGDLGRPLSDIARKFTDDALLRDAEAVLERLTPSEAEVSTPEVQWYIRRILPYRTEDDRIDGVVITFTDITRRKQAEQELSALARSLERQVQQRTRLVRLLQDAAVISNEAESVEDAIRATLQRVCTEFGWPAGHAWLPEDENEQVFADAGLWYLQSPDALAGLVAAERGARVQSGEGTAGRAAESARPVIVHDVQSRMESLRALATNGSRIQSAIAIPILSGTRVVGVLEFFATADTRPDMDLIPGLREIGTQLGRVLERKYLERQVTEATAHEQRFVGQELHDTIAQDITGVGMLVARLAQELEAAGSPLARQAQGIADHLATARDHVRQLAHGLMPVEIEDDGLQEALLELAASCRELHRVDCRADCPQPVTVASSVTAMQLYRIAQEAVQNALRHAAAEHIVVSLRTEDGTCTLRVRDDGYGFEHSDSVPGGVGMQIMRYRAGLVGAKLEIHSQPGSGTEVVCQFPSAG